MGELNFSRFQYIYKAGRIGNIMEEETKGIRIIKGVWKKLLSLKMDRDFSNMTEVIEHLLKNQK